MRPLARRRELVMMDHRRRPQMVHHQHLIRQIKHEIPLIVPPLQPPPDRLELERQIVPERPVQPQRPVIRRAEQV